MTEKAITIDHAGENIRGVLHSPSESCRRRTSVILLHGWSGCRLGPHRMFVKASRRLENLGYHCLRFDFRGRGESDGDTSSAGIPSMIKDTQCCADWMQQHTGNHKVVILGICSACKVAIGASTAIQNVAGLALWSPEPMGHLNSSHLHARRSLFNVLTYLKKLSHPGTWKKILTFRVNTKMVQKAVFQNESADDAEKESESRMLEEFESFRGRLLFVHGTNDPLTSRADDAYSRFCISHGIEFSKHMVMGANHSYYSLQWEDEVISATEEWLDSIT